MSDPARELRLAAASDREACRAQLADNRRATRELFGECSDAQLLWRPAPDAWSIAECLLHLSRTGRAYLPSIDRAIEEGRLRGRTAGGPYRHSWFSRWAVSLLEPPVKSRFKAPAIFAPPQPSGPPAAILDEFEALGAAFGERLDASRGLDLGRLRVASPAMPLFRISLGMAFALMATHERRHLHQARAVAQTSGFPGRG